MQSSTSSIRHVTCGRQPSLVLSVVLFLASVGLMAYLRFVLFPHRFITLTYGLPLLVCLWHRDRALLWIMAGAFSLMSAYKSFFYLPDPNPHDLYEVVQWIMQVINIIVIGVSVHIILNVTSALRASNAELQQANEELTAREEEVTRQNEELQTQTEELAQQNEEIQQQSEELQAQTEEMRLLNSELSQRQSMLHAMLESLRTPANERQLLDHICDCVVRLFGSDVSASAVLEQREKQVVVLACAGMQGIIEQQWAVDRSFAAIVMEKNRTGYIENLADRPDLNVPRTQSRVFRSILATPLRLDGKPVGAVEVYAEAPRQWTTEQFRILEWVAAQCALVLEVRRLQQQLAAANTSLSAQVQERTAQLQEMVNELEHFSYSITHDMRAPLRAMQGYAGLLAADCMAELDEVHQEYLRRITSSAARMDSLITDALSFSRALRQDMPLQKVDAQALLEDILNSYPEFQKPRAEVRICTKLPCVLANQAGLTQCLSNLLGNAVKFVKPGSVPRVDIGAERTDVSVRIWIRDSGIGISPEMRPRVFGMFQRASKDYEGTGIGLALVRKMAERMGGKVGFESEIGIGSCFWIDLKPAEALVEG